MRKWLIPLYLLALMAYVVAGVPLAPFHGDESTLIYSSRDYFEQFVTPDMTRIMNLRTDDALTHELRLLDGRVQLYFGGFVYHLTGGTQAGLNEPWVWGLKTQFNVGGGHVPTTDLLLAERYAMALLLALSIPAAYGVGAHVGGIRGGLLMAALIAVSPNTVLNGRRAMMEAPLLLFSLLTVLAALRLALSYQRSAASSQPATGDQQPTANSQQPAASPQPSLGTRYSALGTLLFTLLLGLGAGMALGSKHSAAFTLVPIFGAFGLWAWRRGAWRRLIGLAGAGLMALLIYFALNPAWWAAPIATAREALELRSQLLEGQVNQFGGYDGLGEYAEGFLQYAVLETPQYYEVPVWEEIGPTIAEYESSPWVLSPALNRLRAIVVVLLAAWGVVVLVRRRDGVAWVAGLWIIGTLAAAFFLTPLPWARYYLIALPAIYALAAAGIGGVKLPRRGAR